MFENPLGNLSILDIIVNVIKFLLGFVGIVALINLIISGIRIITSQGNPEKLKKAKDSFVWTIIGLGLVIGSFFIVEFFIKFITKKF